MAKYLVQHRRGTVEQWAQKSTIIPEEGEIVIEIDEVNSLHKLKIGDGVHTYAELAYLRAGDEIVTQVLAEAKPRVITITLESTWTQDAEGKYSQTIALNNITNHSRLDLQPTADMISEFKQLGLVFVTENNGGTITVYSVGNMPLKSYTMQATIVETECDGYDNPIVGIPISAPTAQSIDEMSKIFVKQEEGKGLSTNDFTNEYKDKLDNLDIGDSGYVHPDSGVVAGTYKSVTVDAQGHVIAGENPTTLSGFGITDAATSDQGAKADTAVQSVKIGDTEYKSGTNVVLPAYPTTLPASDVSDWAKADEKPTYTASEVGALPADTQIPSIEGLATETYVDNKVSSLVDSAPETLDTLNELAAALGDDPNFATTVLNQIGAKVDKVEGKGLSTNDYTTADKNKLASLNVVKLYNTLGTNTDGSITQAKLTELIGDMETFLASL